MKFFIYPIAAIIIVMSVQLAFGQQCYRNPVTGETTCNCTSSPVYGTRCG